MAGRAVSLQTSQAHIPRRAARRRACPAGPTCTSTSRWTSTSAAPSPSPSASRRSGWSPARCNSPLTTPRQNRAWQAAALVVIDRDLATERDELLAFLRQIHDILDLGQQQDHRRWPTLSGRAVPQQQQHYRTKVQFYLWDSLQYEHLTRVVGRHLQAILANQNINYLAWLFPPEDLLPNPDLATRRRRSPSSATSSAACWPRRSRTTTACVEVARLYHDQYTAQQTAQQLAVNPSFIPFRIHALFGVP